MKQHGSVLGDTIVSKSLTDSDLGAIDSKVAGAVEDDEEVGQGSAYRHLSTPDVDS